MFAYLHMPYRVLFVSSTTLKKHPLSLYSNYFLMISMINCILPTDSLVFAELRHFVNRFQTPLPSSWIHSPIKTLRRLSCSMIGRIFSQVVLLALPHIHFIQGRDVPISSQIPARHFVLFYQQACVTPPQIFDNCIICPVQRICVIPEQWSIIQTLYGEMNFFLNSSCIEYSMR